jgi:uncharacterized protein
MFDAHAVSLPSRTVKSRRAMIRCAYCPSVKFRKGARLDTSQIDDLRGGRGRSSGGGMGGGLGGMLGGGRSGGGGGIPMGGKGMGGGALILVLVMGVLFTMCQGGGGGGGLDSLVGQSLGGGAQGSSGDNSGVTERCQTGEDANESRECRIVAVVNSVNEYWTREFQSSGQTYTPAITNFFDSQVNTGCGPGSPQSGPFYCPADQEIYIPLDFFDLLTEPPLDAQGGPFAEAYVVAHEYGHHVSNLIGAFQQVGNDRTGPTSGGVRLELQADCFAAVWAGNAERTQQIEDITEADIREGLDAARAVGDDAIQRATQGSVNPDSFSHGTSEQRQRWFTTGLRSADPASCDTFSIDGSQL